MHVAGRDQHFVEFFCECVDLTVDVTQILVRMDGKAVVNLEEVVVVDGLDLEEVVEPRDLLQLLIRTPRDNAADEFARLARRADDDPRTVLLQHGARHTRTAALLRPAKVADVREGDELVEIVEPRLILRQEDDVVCACIVGAVNEVAFHPIDDLDVRALLLKRTRRIHGLRKRLYNTMIRDGDSRPAPACSRLDEDLRRDDGIERAHLRMCVQLDALHLCRILALRDRATLHAVNEEHIVADEFIVFDLALYANRAALADALQDALDLGVNVLLCRLPARGEKLLARNPVCAIREFEQEDVRTGLEFVRLWSKDLTLKDDVLHLVLDHADLTHLTGDTAPKDDIFEAFFAVCSL